MNLQAWKMKQFLNFMTLLVFHDLYCMHPASLKIFFQLDIKTILSYKHLLEKIML